MFVICSVYRYDVSMPRISLSKQQAAIYSVLVNTIDEKGLCPTQKEIGDVLGISKVTVYEHLCQIIKKGYLTRRDNMSRSLRIVEPIASQYVEGRRMVDILHKLAWAVVKRGNDDIVDDDGVARCGGCGAKIAGEGGICATNCPYSMANSVLNNLTLKACDTRTGSVQ